MEGKYGTVDDDVNIVKWGNDDPIPAISENGIRRKSSFNVEVDEPLVARGTRAASSAAHVTGEVACARGCSMGQAAFNLFLYMFGATQIPYALGQMGWYWGGFFMLTMAVSSFHSGHLISDISIRKRRYSWPEIGFEAFGRRGQLAIEALQTISFMLSGIVQTQGSGSQWQQAFPKSSMCQWQWLFISTLFYAAFLQIPSFSGSLPMKAATLITVVLTVWRVLLLVYYIPAEGQYCHICFGGQTLTSVLSAAANLVFTFGSHAMMPEEVREMAIPEEMHRAYNWAYMVCIPLYFLIGFSGFWSFGVFNSGANMLLNFPDSTAVRAYMVGVTVLGLA